MYKLSNPFLLLTVLVFIGIFVAINRCHAARSLSSPLTKPFREGYLRVSALHEIWYAEYGNPLGVAVVVLHGGPGAGCNDDDVQFFDPKFWRIILLDQRGAKRSKPFAEMKENTTQNLVADLETLRKKLGIHQWLIFGGSWGSSLAMAYGEAHPSHVLGFILRGVFFASKSECEHLWYGMRDIFPDVWQEMNDFLPKAQRQDLIHSYYQLVMNPNLKIALPAARAFLKYDLTCAFLKVSAEQLKEFMSDDALNLGVARTFTHYTINNFFLEENQLINNINKINQLPLIIVHGRYDIITLPKSAYLLHKLWPGSQLILVEASGHAADEPAMISSLTEATERMKKILSKVSEVTQ